MKRILFLLISIGMMYQKVEAKDTALPADKIALRYRIEFLDGKEWKPVEGTKKFKKNHTIRIRFTCDEAGTLYVLNTSDEGESLHPIFPQDRGEGLRRYLGTGTRIGENRVGVFPDPQQGDGGLRFTGVEGREKFLFVYMPDELDGQREMMAIPAGAESWDFGHKTSHRAIGDRGKILFHYFELKSK